MARFDEMLDKFIYKTKEIASNVGDKTSQVIETSRLKYRQNQVAEELEKSYMKLGVIVYEAKQNKQDFDTLIEKSVQDISLLNQRYDQLEDSIALVGKADVVATADVPFSMDEDTLEDIGDIDCVVCSSELDDPLEELGAEEEAAKPIAPITIEVMDTKEEEKTKETEKPAPKATIDAIVAEDKPVEVATPAEIAETAQPKKVEKTDKADKADKADKTEKPEPHAKHAKHGKKGASEASKAEKEKEHKTDKKDDKKKPEEPKK